MSEHACYEVRPEDHLRDVLALMKRGAHLTLVRDTGRSNVLEFASFGRNMQSDGRKL
jgi:hypothetical protein